MAGLCSKDAACAVRDIHNVPVVDQSSAPAAGNRSAPQPGRARPSDWRCGSGRGACYAWMTPLPLTARIHHHRRRLKEWRTAVGYFTGTTLTL